MFKCISLLKSYLSGTLGITQFTKNPNISISKSAYVKPKTSISCGPSGRVIIDEEAFINELCSIDTWESVIYIGHSVLIGPGSVLNTHHHCFESNDTPIKKQNGTGKPIIIEEDVWIGANCTILGGVRIGAHSIIGAHTLVNRDIPPHSVAFGVPCKVKRRRIKS